MKLLLNPKPCSDYIIEKLTVIVIKFSQVAYKMIAS